MNLNKMSLLGHLSSTPMHPLQWILPPLHMYTRPSLPLIPPSVEFDLPPCEEFLITCKFPFKPLHYPHNKPPRMRPQEPRKNQQEDIIQPLCLLNINGAASRENRRGGGGARQKNGSCEKQSPRQIARDKCSDRGMDK